MKPPRITRRGLIGLLGASPLAAGGSAGGAAARAGRTAEPLTLIHTSVAGAQYHAAADSLSTLAPGAPLTLRREPGNPHDPRAIEVFDESGRKLGYVPRVDNPAIARMIDAGEPMRARVTAIDRATSDIHFTLEWLRG